TRGRRRGRAPAPTLSAYLPALRNRGGREGGRRGAGAEIRRARGRRGRGGARG
uniref:Uncharacterized protein n=1 Tax=Oryza brachyantha TaxID=4533 RepID=J3MT49_ORYBR